jgi:uncharacterized protein YbbK (DUF523 family)
MEMEDKIRIGVSACLLGQPVRFDGGHKHDRYLANTLGEYLDFVPVCPEVESGFSIPRETLRLVGDPEAPRLVTSRTNIDHTDRMLGWAGKRVRELEAENLCGFIFKSDSPSSGLMRVKVYNPKGMAEKKGLGLFARAFTRHFPLLPVEEEGRLNDPVLRETFIEQIFTLKRWRETLAFGQNMKNLNVIEHILGYFKKQLDPDEKQEMLEIFDRYRNAFVPLIVPVTLLNHYVRKTGEPYLKQQVYLNPHPIALKLRNHA